MRAWVPPRSFKRLNMTENGEKKLGKPELANISMEIACQCLASLDPLRLLENRGDEFAPNP